MRAGGALLLALVAAACVGSDEAALPVACGTLAVIEPTSSGVRAPDTLDILVHVDSLRTGASGAALVRVDPLLEGGVVFDVPPPSTAAVVSAAFTLAGVFQGCFAESPSVLLVRTPAAPRGKAWVRVASDRTVRVRVQTGWPGADPIAISEWAVVSPGRSGTAVWRAPEAP